MTLRFVINIVRWSWGFAPLQVNEITAGVAMTMIIGFFIDMAIADVVYCAVKNHFTEKRKGDTK